MSILLSVLETSEHPTSLALLELAVSVPFNGENPSASHKVFGFELPDVDEIEDIIVEPRLDLGRLGLNEHTSIDLELFHRCFLSRTILAGGV